MKSADEHRRENIRRLIAEVFDDKPALLAEQLKIPMTNFSRYYTAQDYGRPISTRLARRIEKAAQKAPNWLDNPHQPATDYLIPLLTWEQAGSVLSGKPIPKDAREVYFPPDYVLHGRFSLKVEDDAMRDDTNDSIPMRSLILVDAELDCQNDMTVIVQLKGQKTPLLRRLRHTGDYRFLIPLNKSYPSIEIKRGHLVGCAVVVLAIQYLQPPLIDADC